MFRIAKYLLLKLDPNRQCLFEGQILTSWSTSKPPEESQIKHYESRIKKEGEVLLLLEVAKVYSSKVTLTTALVEEDLVDILCQ